MIRMALASAKNSVATTTTPATGLGWAGRNTATTIAPSVDTEITANISQWPGRSGPLTLPAIIAPNSVSAATPPTSSTSRVRARQLSHGRRQLDEHREPRHAGNGDQIDLHLAEQLGVRDADRSHRVQRHHQRKATQTDGRQAPAPACADHGPTGTARATRSA